MDDAQLQLWTYLNWLQDSGQVFVRSAEARPELDEPEATALEETVPVPPAKHWDLSFVSAIELNADERTMVQKIAAALGFPEGTFQIVTLWNDGEQERTVFLGEAPEGARGLKIAHPREMMKDPSLKRQAWENLQGIKRS